MSLVQNILTVPVEAWLTDMCISKTITTMTVHTINRCTHMFTQIQTHTDTDKNGHKPRTTTVIPCTPGHPGARQSTCHMGLYALHQQCHK